MNPITSRDKGKRYFMDGQRELEVELIDALVNNPGYVKVKFFDGRLLNVEEARLTEIIEISTAVTDEFTIDLEYPQKVSKLTMEIFDAETGEVFTKWLEGADAEQWNDWMRMLCYKAEELGLNPKWLTLNWKAKRKK